MVIGPHLNAFFFRFVDQFFSQYLAQCSSNMLLETNAVAWCNLPKQSFIGTVARFDLATVLLLITQTIIFYTTSCKASVM